MVADHGAHHGPVLLLDVRAIVAVARPGPGEGDLPLLAPVQQVVVDELTAALGVDTQQRERQDLRDVLERGEHPLTVQFGTDRFSVQPVAMSVTVSV